MPQAEIEILPPEHGAQPRPRDGERVRVRQRIYVARPGPLALLLGLVAVGALVVIGLVAFLGLILLWLPVLGAMAAALVVRAFLRGPRRP